MTGRITLVLALGVVPGTGANAQQPIRFRISVAGGVVSGWEEFTLIAMGPGGFQLTGRAEMTRGSERFELVQNTLLGVDRGPGRYRLTLTARGATQSIESWREGDTVRVRATAGAQEQARSIPVNSRTLFLDNLVASHFQVLLDRYLAEPEASRGGEWTFVVPQALTAVRGTITATGEASGALDGRPVTGRRYALEAGGNVVEITATADGALLRVTVPVQRVELIREGYVDGAASASPPEPLPCEERDVRVPAGADSLPGTLCVPRATEPVAVVVLTHGSGPNDRDETIGPNKPFRDIARGLAAAGIASLRYDKRTFALRGRLDPAAMTVEEEVIADAVAAVRVARAQPGIDPARAFLLGHSLGGTLAPLAAERLGRDLRGIVLLAPGARPLDSVVVEQTAFRMRVAGQSDSLIAAQTADLVAAFARVRSGVAPDSEVVLGASARYWRDLFARRPLDALRRLGVPVLVLQGGKDYQVTRADYELVQAALAGKAPGQALTVWLPDLNHLFMKVAGQSTGAEYGLAGRVDEQAIAQLVRWITEQR
jgi:pimeloyl-ACP methyl ester carboxylesterase